MPALSDSVSRAGIQVAPGVEILPGGAARLTEENVLVVADLHLGVEAALEYEGLSLPRVQTKKIEEYLASIILSGSPSMIIVAGDLKHNFSRNLRQEWEDVRRFVKALSAESKLQVVKGNHDNYLGLIVREFEVPLKTEISISGVRVLHGHKGELDGRMTIMGHIHPSLRLRDSVGASVKDRCFLYNQKRRVLVLPALSLAAYGTDVVSQQSSDSISPLLSDTGLSDFEPIMFSGTKPLRFPKVRELRRERELRLSSVMPHLTRRNR